MSAKYEQEQAGLRTEIEKLKTEVSEHEGQLGDIEKFITCTRELKDIETLTPAIVNALIDKIIVYEAGGKHNGKGRTQQIEIHYRFVGSYDVMD